MLTTKGKTEYRFNIQNAQDTEQKIQSWLSANSFQPIQEDGVLYYRGGDAITGHRFLEYRIEGAQVIIYAYIGSFQKPYALTDGIAGAMAIVPYKNILEPLFVSLSTNENQTQQSSPITQPQIQTQQQNNYASFDQTVNKKNSTYAEISFWVSILMLTVSFFGIIVGAIIVIFNYYLAAQGLKSSKKGKSIAAIIISSIAIIVMIIKLILELSK